VDGVLGLAVGFESHRDNSGAECGIDLDAVSREAHASELSKCGASIGVVAQARNKQCVGAERMCVVGEIGRRTAELPHGRQDVPEQFTDSNHSEAHDNVGDFDRGKRLVNSGLLRNIEASIR